MNNTFARYVSDAQPVANEIIIEDMLRAHERAYCYLEFSSDNFQTLILPGAGAATIEASENGTYWGSVVDGTDIDVTIGDYARPTVAGAVKDIRANPVIAITGPTEWRLVVARY